MRITLSTDDFGRMVCEIATPGHVPAVVTSSDFGAACAALGAAVDDVARTGVGECYWSESNGEYRWMFRTAGDNVRVAVMWSIGVMTGWEHVVWLECSTAEFLQSMGEALVSQTSAK